MNALLWKKVNEMKQNKYRMGALIIVPILFLVILLINKRQLRYIVSYFPLMIILLNAVIMFSIEDLVMSEIIFATRLSIKKIWEFNIFIITISGYIYSNIILLVYILINGLGSISIGDFFNNLFCIVIGCGLIGFSTLHLSDYSTVKQWVSSIGAVFNLILMIALLAIPFMLEILTRYEYNLVAASLFMFLISYLILRFKSSKENLIINVQSLSKVYSDTQTIDE
ncbi:hypothetical protein [Clostridium estertheticum]|uniref:hypothetical protein n=1 Tax=Clostridium estertheticum TaxID=238834 RepID=UPI001CF20A8A|nr:hypothetical protein [Clostridium estertheticum]MCB2362193.1 hypothetical protein [Clostridium estertheticum]